MRGLGPDDPAWDQQQAPDADLHERIVWGIILFVCLTLLILAASIDPDRRGHGTHEQLGLPPCGIVEMYDVPCPSCGYTTTFAYAIRMRWIAAIVNQPFAFIVFLFTLAGIPTALRVIVRRWSILYTSQSWPWTRIVLGGIALWLAAWAYKWYTWIPNAF